jgi:SAM-dependent methyltransferase
MVEQSKWIEITKSNPDHSAWYIGRFQEMEAAGNDLVGEARLVDTMAPRGARILDAGCGPGRTASHLARLGHTVVGVDVDPELIAEASKDTSGPLWFVQDLAVLDLPTEGVTEAFDVILSVGNVMTFLAPSTRTLVLARLRDHLADDGRIVVGFGAGRGYDFDEFFADAAEVGLTPQVQLGTWDMRPLTPESDFLVAILGKA